MIPLQTYSATNTIMNDGLRAGQQSLVCKRQWVEWIRRRDAGVSNRRIVFNIIINNMFGKNFIFPRFNVSSCVHQLAHNFRFIFNIQLLFSSASVHLLRSSLLSLLTTPVHSYTFVGLIAQVWLQIINLICRHLAVEISCILFILYPSTGIDVYTTHSFKPTTFHLLSPLTFCPTVKINEKHRATNLAANFIRC